eukprot:COSAG05_NODE_5456_length_1168_cov_6.617206_2_plen_102_part_00
MSCTSRKKHTNAILMSLYEEMKRPEKSLDTDKKTPTKPADAAIEVGNEVFTLGPTMFLISPCHLAPNSPLLWCRAQNGGGPKEFLPAYLSTDRHEAAELVE